MALVKYVGPARPGVNISFTDGTAVYCPFNASVTVTTPAATSLLQQPANWAAGDVASQAYATNGVEAQTLVDRAVAAGRQSLTLDDRVYDNAAATLVIPSGFTLLGSSHDTSIIDLPLTGDSIQMGPYSEVGRCFLRIKGAIQGPALGVSPAPSSNGIVMGPKAWLHDCFLQRFHTAIRFNGDHQLIERNETFECAVGVFESGAGGSRGNLGLKDNRFVGLTFAGLFIAVGTEIDSLESYRNHWGFSPYGWFGHSTGGQHEFAITNVSSSCDSFEAFGNRAIDIGNRKISGDFYTPRSGPHDAAYRLANGVGTFSGIYTTGNGAYVFESQNVTGKTAAVNGNYMSIWGSGGDTQNGPFLGPGSTGVFHTNP